MRQEMDDDRLEIEPKENLYQQDSEIEFLSMLLPLLKYKTFIDIGAEEGSFSRFLVSYGLKGVIVEPAPKFTLMLSSFAEQNGCVLLSYAIHHQDDMADFYSAFDCTNQAQHQFSSLHPLNNDRRLHHKKVATVCCRSLNSLLQEGVIDQRIGILKIDTEGNDLNVLKGMTDVKPEIIMCEFFMPGVYQGWELGHPSGLIEEAKKLGFNHYIAIKRFDEYEMCSINSNTFVDEQWGNLIFIADNIYEATKNQLFALLRQKEVSLSEMVLRNTQDLRQTCNERLGIIQILNPEIKTEQEVKSVTSGVVVNNNNNNYLFCSGSARCIAK